MTITLSPADSTHTGLLIELMHELYHYDHDKLDEANARAALHILFDETVWGRAWLVMDRDQPVGYVVLTFGFSLEYGGRDAIIDELYLRQSHRGRGVGSQVLAFLIDYCRAEGINALHLEVFNHNQRAYRFYRRHGFRERNSRFMSLIDL